MKDLINPNIRSIIHILNNWNFQFDGSYVTADLKIHITKEELKEIKEQLMFELQSKQNSQTKPSDEEVSMYHEAIADLVFAMSELEKSRV